MNKKIVLLASATLFLLAPTFNSALFSAGYADKKVEVVVEKPAKMMSDSDITRAVKDAFAADKTFAASVSNVSIKTDKGMVTLSGFVSSEKAKMDAVAKAKGVEGVKGVVDNLAVKPAKDMK